MSIAIMQPYFMPYVGYFQLINSVDRFFFLDDVNFIKKGWINRNKIIVNNSDYLFTIPLKEASQNKLICDIQVGYDLKWVSKFLITIKHNYSKAPYYSSIYSMLNELLINNINKPISDLAIESISRVYNYLEVPFTFEKTSEKYKDTKPLIGADRLIEICKLSNENCYINPNGGLDLYDKNYFEANGIELNFIKNDILNYNQLNNQFVPAMSVIDMLMFCSKEEVNEHFNSYSFL